MGKFFFQINHCGCRIEPDCLNERIPKGASGLLDLTNKKSESLSNSEIEDIISQFIKCAKLCEYAGADGVQYLNSFRQDTITVMINGDYLNQMIKYD